MKTNKKNVYRPWGMRFYIRKRLRRRFLIGHNYRRWYDNNMTYDEPGSREALDMLFHHQYSCELRG